MANRTRSLLPHTAIAEVGARASGVVAIRRPFQAELAIDGRPIGVGSAHELPVMDLIPLQNERHVGTTGDGVRLQPEAIG
jgi:hypothetical protein